METMQPETSRTCVELKSKPHRLICCRSDYLHSLPLRAIWCYYRRTGGMAGVSQNILTQWSPALVLESYRVLLVFVFTLKSAPSRDPRHQMYLSPWVSLIVAVCISMVCSLNEFPKKIQVSQKGASVNLTCHTDFQGQVTWKQKLQGKEKILKESRFVSITGLRLFLHKLDTPDAGEYSCWGEGRKLDHTYLLLEAEEEESYDSDVEDEEEEDEEDQEEERDSLSCSTRTYSCSFTCRLSASGFTAARLSFHRYGQQPTQWHYAPTAQNHFQFTLPLSYSPFAEESAALVVTAEAANSNQYLKKTIQFYLRDIVQPDPPQTVTCERAGNALRVTVQPPVSWAQPVSYFPLEHEIEFINKDNGKTERVTSGVITQKVSRLRARSRDPLTPSAWSEWSPWKNVTRRTNKRKDRAMSGETVSLSFRKNDAVICQRKRKGRKRCPDRDNKQ
ncbi:interleukin-12 subunit beta isoform X1 [Anguilla anguilla]|uniref:interleukin-12 subunit beta isoform X1 n=1 Tax=Anguilla anguilla TaxID=7936 RepID=UPI0015AB414B|nr:interleukin-12 subunit beta isoform X1 [Anguilla anguilla]